jgi:integrase
MPRTSAPDRQLRHPKCVGGYPVVPWDRNGVPYELRTPVIDVKGVTYRPEASGYMGDDGGTLRFSLVIVPEHPLPFPPNRRDTPAHENMARKIRSTLETRTARLKKPVAKKPDFVKIAPGISLGYRRNATAGTWVLRVADGKGANWTKAIGLADDYDEPNGSTVFDYWQAQDLAKATASAGKGGTPVGDKPVEDKPPTLLRAALDQYEADLKTRGGDAGNVIRIRAHMDDKLLDKHVVALTLDNLRTWRDGLTAKTKRKAPESAKAAKKEKWEQTPLPRRLAPSGINRVCTALKAALNLAADRDERINSRRPGEQGLATLPDAEESRNVILTDPQIRKLVEGAPTQGEAFGLFVEALASTGARVSQLARVNVGDLQDDRADPRVMVPSSRKGNGKKAVLRRPVPISPDFAKRLRKTTEGKPADAPLFVKPSGVRWSKSDHSRLFARVVKTKEVRTDDDTVVTINALRHSSIVRQLLANVPVRVVAALHDTSVQMIERTYSRHIADHTDAMARAAMFSTDAPVVVGEAVVARATEAVDTES